MAFFTYKLVDDNTYAIMSYEGEDAEVTIPAVNGGRPVTILFDELFKNHTELKKITIPDSVTNIGGFVFDGCENLKYVKLPDQLEEMWQYAFVRSSIELIEIPGTVTSIVPFTFKDCKNLTTVVIRKGVKRIRARAFEGCENLELVAIPSDIEISHDAFIGCSKLNPNLIREMKATCRCPECTRKLKLPNPASRTVNEYLKSKSKNT